MVKSIAYITDIHLDEQFPIENGVDARANWKLLLEDVASRGISEIVFGGDIGEKSSNEWFFDTLKDFDLNITLGNHDDFSEASKHFTSEHRNGNDALYYSFTDGPFKYIFLDSSTGLLSDTQFEWLRQQLESASKILLFLHHPILAVQTNLELYWPLKGRDRIHELLKKTNKEVTIFCGHYHTDDVQTDGNITQLMTPAASYQTKRNPGLPDIPGFSRAYATPDGGTTWNPMPWNQDEVIFDHTVVSVNNDTFGYRILTIEEGKIDTELLLYKDDKFVTAVSPHYHRAAGEVQD